MQQYLYVGHTLVDITKTNQKVFAVGREKERNQQRNWETLVQVLGLRIQLTLLDTPSCTTMDVASLKFGEDYTGQHKIWRFRFSTETPDAFLNTNGPTGALELDLQRVPIITGLDESVEFTVAAFHVHGPQKNIFVEPADW